MKRLMILCLALMLCVCAAAETYTASLPAGKAIHAGPGSNYAVAQTLDKAGVFTIADEEWDKSGNLWGKLKSGAGWVLLTEAISYTRALPAGTAVRTGPGREYSIAKTIDENGVFTIVAEKWDDAGNLWGKLKSGAGWVYLQSTGAPFYQPISADYADNHVLSSVHHRLIADNSEYAVHMAFFASEPLRDVTFSSLALTDEGYDIAEHLFTLGKLTPDIPMVISADFPGDMSAYALTFTDASGVSHRYNVYISGMDGSLELIEENT